ncbi:MAG: hypothetical protein ACF8MF_13505 [Phycisphaerales bacterium JB052]
MPRAIRALAFLMLTVAAHDAIAQEYCGSNTLDPLMVEEDESRSDWFGYQTAMIGDQMVASAPIDHGLAPATGVVYIAAFDEDEYTFVRQLTLHADDSMPGDRFGQALAATSEHIYVGAPYHQVGAFQNAGAIYEFTFDGSQWIQTAKITASTPQLNAGFGRTVSISDDARTLLIGAMDESFGGTNTGAAYIFERQDDHWAQTRVLQPPNQTNGDKFGFDTTLSPNANYAIVSAPGTSNSTGSVFAYRQINGEWILQNELTASDALPYSFFGWSVAATNRQIMVGAPNARVPYLDEQYDSPLQWIGAAYAFHHDGPDWVEHQRIEYDHWEPNIHFGKNLDLLDNYAIITAEGTNLAMLYEFHDSEWDMVRYLDTETSGSIAVSLGNRFMAVSQHLGFNHGGIVYPYMHECPLAPCTADLNEDQATDFFDVAIFIDTYATGDPDADFNDDGRLDFYDIADFIASYLRGCPD